MIAQPHPFFVLGGTLRGDAPSYVHRGCDEAAFTCLRQGQFCYVLTARQMGKSSLMVRTAQRLRQLGCSVAVVDLTAFGLNLSLEQWYTSLVFRIGEQLELEDIVQDFWAEKADLSPLQRWTRTLKEVVLPRTAGTIVIFIDEIDVVRSLRFDTSEFFAAMRELHNLRAVEPDLERLAFCLLGVSTPSELIQDPHQTPFNVGVRIELTDFSRDEAAVLEAGLGVEAEVAGSQLDRILHWTGGHPYLTQRLCMAVSRDAEERTAASVDRLCTRLFLSARARELDDNLLYVRNRLLQGERHGPQALALYRRLLARERIPYDDSSPEISVLYLSGIVRIEDGELRVRNRIYEQAFDLGWLNGVQRSRVSGGSATSGVAWQRSAPVPTDASEDLAKPGGEAGRRVLLVDDDAGYREPVAEYLREKGYRVDVAAGIDEGVSKLRAEGGAYHVVFADQNFLDSGRSGLELLRIAVAEFPRLPVVIVTGWGTKDLGRESLRSGAYRYISKAAAVDELELIIELVPDIQ